MEELLNLEWVPTPKDSQPLTEEEQEKKLALLGNRWHIEDDLQLEKEYRFPDFKSALEFTNRVGEFAEEKNHHPVIELTWGSVELEIYTHDIGGLALMDFVWAANVEKIYQDEFAHLVKM